MGDRGADEGGGGGGYRDRAAERRAAEVDAEEEPAAAHQQQEVAGGISLLGYNDGGAVFSEKEQHGGNNGTEMKSEMISANAHARSIAMSKFLGGDVEHTHLVKGLDYALLRRVREELEQREIEDQEEQIASQQMQDEMWEAEMLPEAKTTMGRAVQKWLLGIQNNEKEKPTQKFLPGRMTYTYDADPSNTMTMPKITIRSAEECERSGQTRYTTFASCMGPDLMKRVMNVMTSDRAAKTKKLRKKERAAKLAMLLKEEEQALRQSVAMRQRLIPGKATESAFDDEDDMFADDDNEEAKTEGQISVQKSSREISGLIGKSGGSYFSTGGRTDVATKSSFGLGKSKVSNLEDDLEKRAELEKEAETKRRERLLRLTQDGYDECYPDYIGFDSNMMDDDDEADDGDGKRAKSSLKKKDGSMMSEKEIADADAAGKRKKKDAKFASNLAKIEGIIKRREEERTGGASRESEPAIKKQKQ